MLFIGKKQITREQFGTLFNVSKQVKKIEDRPIFDIHKDRINKDIRGHVKKSEGFSMPAKMWVRIPDGKEYGQYKAGEKVELRYVASVVPERQKDGSMVEVFKPKSVRFRGDAFPNKSYADHKDLAVYMYFATENAGSPFRVKGLKYSNYYTHNDPSAKAAIQINEFSKIKASLAHAETASIADLLTMARGLRRGGNRVEIIDETNDQSVRAGMMAFAASQPSKYYAAIEDKVLQVKGKIVELIEKGVLVLAKKGGGRQWEWASGERQGEPVGNPIYNHGSDARGEIINFFISNLEVYADVLNSASSNIKADQAAHNYFNSVKQEPAAAPVQPATVPEYLLNAAHSGPAESLPNPEDNEACKDFVAKRGYKKIPEKVAAFRQAIRENNVTDATADIYLRELYAQ